MKVYEILYFDPLSLESPNSAGFYISEGLANEYIHKLLDLFPEMVFNVKEVKVNESMKDLGY